MAYSAGSPRKCRGECGQRRPASEFNRNGRVCRACLKATPPVPVPLGNGTTAIVLVGKHARGRVAIVSDAKVPIVAPFRWRVMEYVNRNGVKTGPYAVSKRPTGRKDSEMLYMHILITGMKGIDHRDGNPLNNTDENLFKATQSQNCVNRGKQRTGGTSDYLGVDLHKPSGKWRARIRVNRIQDDLGLFPAEEDAARARDLRALQVHGLDDRGRPVARLNFPFGGYRQDPDGTWILARYLQPQREPRHGPRRDRDVPPPADLAEGLSPELRATLGELFPGDGEKGGA